jgi:sugar-specific transcriptional regulator TrmB
VLERLEGRGIAQSIEEGGKKKYVPLEYGLFMETQRNRLFSTLETLGEELAGLGGQRDASIIWNLRTYESLLETAVGMVERAEKSLLLSLWAQELEALAPPVENAIGRGVKAALVHFGPVTVSLGQVLAHPIEDTIYAEKGGRGFTMVVDGRQALMATVFQTRRGQNPKGRPAAHHAVEGAWSLNRGFVVLAEDYIKHDIYIMKIVRRFDPLLIKRFGQGYSRLRDVYSDTEERE